MEIQRIPEQIQAEREARRERFTRLKSAFDALTDTQKKILAGMVVYTCDGHQISATNTVLVNLQRADVSIIGGYRQWQAQNRHVRKGEKSISIWVPLKKAVGVSSTSEDIEEDIKRFRLQSVFDISQTEKTESIGFYKSEYKVITEYAY